jgi:hypothetical protein
VLKAGTKFSYGQTVEVAEKGVVVLLRKEKAVLLNAKGSYSYKNVENLFATTNRSVTDRYIEYIWKKAQQEGGDPDDEGKGDLKIGGVVFRGETMMISPEDSSVILGDFLPLKFEALTTESKLFIFRKSRIIDTVNVETLSYDYYCEPPVNCLDWVGFSFSENGSAVYSGIKYYRWADDEEKKEIQLELSQIKLDLLNFPQDFVSDLIDNFYKINRFVP